VNEESSEHVLDRVFFHLRITIIRYERGTLHKQGYLFRGHFQAVFDKFLDPERGAETFAENDLKMTLANVIFSTNGHLLEKVV